MTTYQNFLENKIKIAPKTGFDVDPDQLHPILFPHQRDIVVWSLKGGCRAVFASFGLGKTAMQLETLRQIILHRPGCNVLIVCPLGVRQEFARDAKMLGIDHIQYITSTNELTDNQQVYITNYERVRRGAIDASKFTAVCFDEASILRSLDTDTTQTILETFAQVEFRFVHTATPAPNRYLELINYAEYLGIMDRGQALTRFFERDSTTAGNLTLYPRREKEFWHWMASWAAFVTRPSDLGHTDAGYDLPELTVTHHRISFERPLSVDKKTRIAAMFADSSKSLADAAKEKRDSIPHRIARLAELYQPGFQSVVWCDLNSEQKAIEAMLRTKGVSFVSLYGSEDADKRERAIEAWKAGQAEVFLSKPSMYGSGLNMQQAHRMCFAGITYKFQEFIQAIHRIYRFGQLNPCQVEVIYTDAEEEILKVLMQKWSNHKTLQNEMTEIISTHGLNADLMQQLRRDMFSGRREASGRNWTSVNNDCVAEWATLADNSIGLIHTSIPFGNHYEYSENYNCFGHNEDNEAFFRQMDFLVPHLYRTLMPGRIAAIHVKDRLRYSYMNGTGFSSIDPFSDDTTACFRKHGFHLMARITVDTDVVRENNGSYRLSWSEACKDMTKMGAGLPEYVLVFRKPPTTSDNAYADIPVVHDKEKYSVARWQLDAHAHWKSSGERLLSSDRLRKLDLGEITKLWAMIDTSDRYDYNRHVELAEKLDSIDRLPKTFMVIPPQSNNPDIWDDVSRMKTLNMHQARKGNEKHICPLQLDIIERIIERYSNSGDLVADPFGGIGSVPYQAVRMNRRGFATELNTEYWSDGIKHLKAAEAGAGALTLFDFI